MVIHQLVPSVRHRLNTCSWLGHDDDDDDECCYCRCCYCTTNAILQLRMPFGKNSGCQVRTILQQPCGGRQKFQHTWQCSGSCALVAAAVATTMMTTTILHHDYYVVVFVVAVVWLQIHVDFLFYRRTKNNAAKSNLEPLSLLSLCQFRFNR
jgi:hypothetical protein